MIKEIVSLLKEQKNIYLKLLELSKEKQEAIVKSEPQKVSEIVKLEWEQLNMATETENRRVICVNQLISKLNLDVESLTVSQIASYGTEIEKKELEQLKLELLNIFTEQKSVNEKSKGILDLHFEYTDFMINNFLKEEQLSNIYGNSGGYSDTTSDNKGLIDNQA